MGGDAGPRPSDSSTLRLPLTVCLALLLCGAVIGVGGALAIHNYMQTSRIVLDCGLGTEFLGPSDRAALLGTVGASVGF